MTVAVISQAPRARPATGGALDAAARLWFAVMIGCQAAFLYYILAFYGPSTLTGNFQAWSRNHILIKGYVPGDVAGNLAFAGHVMMAAVVTFGGMVQLVPQIRRHAPALHRWNGRLFMAAAATAALGGLYMAWVRGATTDLTSTIAITIDAALILGFGGLAWRAARLRDFASHRRWAMRTFMVANGVFFIRVGFVAYMLVAGALTGARPAFGPFIAFWGFGSYLVPLAGLELYLRARDGAGPRGRRAVAGVVLVLTLLMGAGSVGAWLFLWAPVLARV